MSRTMRTAGRLTGRLIAVTAGAAAITLAAAATASAHHCYKEDWADAARAHHSQGGTAWLPLSTLGESVVAEVFGAPQCAYVVDGVVAEFVELRGLDGEPLIHSRAVVGGGAAHQGKDVPPFGYLGDADFAVLDSLLVPAVEECLAG